MKNEFCLAIYTKDTSLYLSCDNIAEQEAWLQALVELVEEERTGMPSSSSGVVGQQPQTTNLTSTVPRGPDMPPGKPLFGELIDLLLSLAATIIFVFLVVSDVDGLF